VQRLAYRNDSDFAPFFINETAGLEERSPLCKPKLGDWSDQEITSIRNVLHRLTALRVMNAEDAEDLVQDTFLTMAMKCPEIELEKGLLIWSMGILRKKVGNYYRKAQRNTAVNNERGSALESVPSDPSATSPEIKLRREELCALIYRVLATLPESHRQALELLLAGNYSPLSAIKTPSTGSTAGERSSRANWRVTATAPKPNPKAGVSCATGLDCRSER
jgi:RNA polymerase sigma factor (sigma-70 family)